MYARTSSNEAPIFNLTLIGDDRPILSGSGWRHCQQEQQEEQGVVVVEEDEDTRGNEEE
jgi:hypothetical protein